MRVLGIDRQVRSRPDLGRCQPALGFELGAVERQRPVVVGEAEGHAIGAGDAPAPRQRRRPLVEMGLQRGRKRLHFRPHPRKSAIEASAEDTTPPAAPVRA